MTSSLQGKSVVILTATYNDWVALAHLVPLIDSTLSRLGVASRMLVIDDGSNDMTGKAEVSATPIKSLQSIDVIPLARNMGNQKALAIGIAHVASHMPCDFLIVMDSDHEDKPEYIEGLLNACMESGSEKIMFAERTKRSESPGFRFLYGVYQGLYRMLTGSSIDFGNYSAIPGHLTSRLAHIGELWSHFPASVMRARIPYDKIPSERGVRLHGESKMNLVRLIVHAFSGFTVFADVAAVRVMLGSLLFALFILAGVMGAVVLRLATDIPIVGWTSQMVTLFLIILIQVLSSAILGLLVVLSMRQQTTMIPYHDYEKFVFDTHRIFPEQG